MKSTDVQQMLKLLAALKPAPIAPLAPQGVSEYNKGNESAIAMAKDIEYLRKAVETLVLDLKKITDTHVTVVDFNDHVKGNEKAHTDFETRLREQGARQTQILTWGAVLIFLTTSAQVVMKFIQ